MKKLKKRQPKTERELLEERYEQYFVIFAVVVFAGMFYFLSSLESNEF